MSNLGSIVVELSANVAKFQSDMGKMAAIAEQRLAQIDKATGIVKNSLAALGYGFAVGATIDAVKSKIEGAIESAAGLQRLAERTSANVEALSAMAAVARLSDTDTEELAGGLQKLGKAMVDAENGGHKTSASFKAIGISAASIRGSRPDEMFKLIADRLAMYQDSAEKTTIAQNLLGKAGANLLPMMNDLAVVGDLQTKVTKEQAEQADALEKNQKRLQASTNAIYKTIALETIPAMNAFVKTMLESQNESDGVRKSVQGLAADGSIHTWAENAARSAAFVVDAFDGVQRMVRIAGNAIGGIVASMEMLGEGGGVFSAEGRRGFNSVWADFGKDADTILNKALFSDRLARQIAESQKAAAEAIKKGSISPDGLGNENKYHGPKDDPTKKALEGVLKEQEDFIAREKALLQTREQYLDYYANLEYITRRDAEETKQQMLADSLRGQLVAYAKEKSDLEAYIRNSTEDVVGQNINRQEAINKLAEVQRKAAAAEVEANKRITDSLMALMAIQRQFDIAAQEAERRDRIANESAQFQINLLGQSSLAVLQANAARKFELELEQRIYELRKKDPAADILQAVLKAEQQKQKAVELVTESYSKQRTAAFGESEAFRKYAESAANAAMQMENLFTNAFRNIEDAMVNLVKNGKLDFHALADSIASDLIRIQVRKTISDSSSLIQSAGGVSGIFGGIKSFLGFADGGSPPVGVPSIVGEQGPELFVPNAAGTVLPNHVLAGLSAPRDSGSTYYIDATGADQAAIARLYGLIQQLNGSVERRSVAAVKQAMRTGGGRLVV